MEVSFNIKFFIGKVVDKGSLFDKVPLLLDSNIWHLLFCVSQVKSLFLFHSVSPHGSQLLSFISWVDIIEDWKFRSKEVSEVSYLCISKIESQEELVVPYHASKPFVVGPSTEPWDSAESTNVKEQKDDSSSASRQRFIVRGDLFWSNSLE